MRQTYLSSLNHAILKKLDDSGFIGQLANGQTMKESVLFPPPFSEDKISF